MFVNNYKDGNKAPVTQNTGLFSIKSTKTKWGWVIPSLYLGNVRLFSWVEFYSLVEYVYYIVQLSKP